MSDFLKLDPCKECTLHRCDYIGKEEQCDLRVAYKLLIDMKATTQHQKDEVGSVEHSLPSRWKL